MEPEYLAIALAAATITGLLIADVFEPATGWITKLAVAAGVGAAAYALAPAGGDPAFLIWSMVLTAVLVALSAVDMSSHSVPDVVSIPLIGLGLLHAWLRGLPILTIGATVAIVIGAALLISFIPSKRRLGIGGGDILVLAGGLAWLGPTVALDLVILTGIIMLPLFLWRMSRAGGAADAPAVPALAGATFALWLNGPIF